MIVVILML